MPSKCKASRMIRKKLAALMQHPVFPAKNKAWWWQVDTLNTILVGCGISGLLNLDDTGFVLKKMSSEGMIVSRRFNVGRRYYWFSSIGNNTPKDKRMEGGYQANRSLGWKMSIQLNLQYSSISFCINVNRRI
jgi:hypothetical protein